MEHRQDTYSNANPEGMVMKQEYRGIKLLKNEIKFLKKHTEKYPKEEE